MTEGEGRKAEMDFFLGGGEGRRREGVLGTTSAHCSDAESDNKLSFRGIC